jgi:hypothetical protein
VTVATLASYVAQSARVRPTVQRALDDFELCRITATTGAKVLEHSIRVRQAIMNALPKLRASSVRAGHRLVADLRSALMSSIAADGAFQRWMGDAAPAGHCGTNPAQDANYQDGLKASTAANTAKRAFLGLWNPLARSYHRATYKAGMI